MPVDETLTEEIRRYARSLGADLVGVAPVSRWAKAPIERSPQGIWPQAKSVIVVAIHFLDAPAELGAEEDPRDPGPAMTQMNVSAMLHEVAWKVSRRLQDCGHGALFVRQSGQWRYRAADGDRGWAGDMCHYYAAVCAGLGEVGWNNITLTPQYGPRQRFCSILTDAELEPTPLYDGEPLCDRCKLCATHCPTQSFEKDVSGEMRHIEVEGKRHEFPDRNLWRCAIGENFMLDVFLDAWKHRRVDEDLIVEMEQRAVEEHNEWIKGWKMGMCLKHCMPPQRRYFDRDYCKAPRRRRDLTPSADAETCGRLWEDLVARSRELGVDMVAAVGAEEFAAAGIDLTEIMPDAASAVVFAMGYPHNCSLNSAYHAAAAEIELAQVMQEEYGFSGLPRWGGDDNRAAVIAGLARPAGGEGEKRETLRQQENYSLRLHGEGLDVVTDRFGPRQVWRTILCQAPLGKASADLSPPRVEVPPSGDALAGRVREAARASGADLVGIAPVERFDELAEQLREIHGDEDYWVVDDRGFEVDRPFLWGAQGWPFNPEARSVRLEPKLPADHLAGARSVIVVGLGLLDASVDRAGEPPARKAGHYVTTVHEEPFSQLQTILLRLARVLEMHGHAAAPSRDLMGLAGRVWGAQEDLTACRFAAIAAGLGEIGDNGLLMTPRFGARQRVACLVTDAALPADDVYAGEGVCLRCEACVEACPMSALDAERSVRLTCGGRTFRWRRLERIRCDYAKRYGLIAEAGGVFSGCTNDVRPPERITPEFVTEAVRDGDRIQRPGYTPLVERCFTVCPAHRGRR